MPVLAWNLTVFNRARSFFSTLWVKKVKMFKPLKGNKHTLLHRVKCYDCILAQRVGRTLPFLAWYDPDLLTLPVGCNQPCLPPLVIGGVDDMQDVSVRKTQTLAGQTTVPGSVIVKESPGNAKQNHQQTT